MDLVQLQIPKSRLKFCPVCSSQINPGELKEHSRICDFVVQNPRAIGLKCENCEKSFKNQEDFEEHRYFCHPSSLLADYPEDPDTRDARRSRNSSRNIPESKRPKCDICNKSFCSAQYLETHMRIHTGLLI